MHEPVGGHLPVVLRQGFDGQPEVIQFVVFRHLIRRVGQCDAVLSRRAGGFLNPLQHRVQDRPCEVRFRVGQSLRIVRAGSLA
jgi:hypothetical protein